MNDVSPELKKIDLLLRALIGWGILGVFFGYVCSYSPQNGDEFIGLMFVRWILVYVFGALMSGIPLFFYPALFWYVLLVVVVYHRARGYLWVALMGLWSTFLFSSFTLWIEPWLTLDGIALNLILLVVELSLYCVDVVVTVIWLCIAIAVGHFLVKEL